MICSWEFSIAAANHWVCSFGLKILFFISFQFTL
uniref:Uncharacterized protein n=1 Tax=Manihot esculenta TaxID=3983 RepID=A0A2C9W8F7_MANES